MKLRGEMDSPEAMGRMLQQGRLLSGLSQRELADRVGASQRYIWEMESGKPSVFTDRLFAIMRQTGIKFYAEIDDEDESPDA